MSLFVVESHPQSLATAACTGLDHDGIANCFGDLNGFFGALYGFIDAWNGIDIRKCSQFFRGDFVSHCRNRLMFGTNEDDRIFFTPTSKIFVFAEEAIAWVNGLGTCFFGSRNNHVAQKIAFTTWCRANAN